LGFDLKNGAWKQWIFKDREYLQAPLLPNFWRVPVDNDGESLLEMSSLPVFIGRLLLRWRHWKKAAEKRKLVKFEIVQRAMDTVQICTAFKIPGGKKPLEVNYSIFGNGDIEIAYVFTPKKNLLRAGLQTQIPRDFRKITWFGRGPEESMLDRKTGYALGIYQRDIEDFIHNYVRPQENANRTDVRWARFTNEAGQGFEIQSLGAHFFNFSAWPYTMDDLERADHIHELPRRDTITLNIDYGQKGVGDLTSAIMGLPEDAQLLPGQKCDYRFLLKAIDSGKL
jgi:beta-galactosidase